MDILTLIKANIHRRKGTFISIVLLMFTISTALTLILSVNQSCTTSLNEANSLAETGNIIILLKDSLFTDEMQKKLDDEPIIDHYRATRVAVASYGMDSKKVHNSISCFFSTLPYGIRLVNKSCTGYDEKIPELSKGEIYLSYGSKSKYKCDIGDTVTAHTISGDYDFKIKGFVVEPVFGAMNIGWKHQFISQEDFDIIMAANEKNNKGEKWGTGYLVEVYKSDDCKLSDGKFRRQVNLDTDIISNSWGSITKDMSKHYTNIYSDNTLSIMLIFILILAIVVLIVTGHSISTNIELDQTNLGILKSQGFSSARIRLSLILQYFITEIVGSFFGIICAIPLINVLAGVFEPISGYIIEIRPALGRSLLFLLIIFAVNVIFIFFITHKVCNISPIRAISGGRNEIYFDSRLKVPINAKAVSVTLALRQFTSAKRRYISSIIISAILVFFMLMTNALSDAASSKNALEMIGVELKDVNITFDKEVDKPEIDKLLDTVEKHTKIGKRHFSYGAYLSINGEEIYCSYKFYPEDIITTKGRAPIYDNEIVVTEIVADELDLKIGDTVDVAKYDKHQNFIVSGIYTSMNDTGMATSINAEAGKKLGINIKLSNGGITLKDTSDTDKVISLLKNEYGDKAEITKGVHDETFELIETALKSIRKIIYSFSLFFALIVVAMVSSKTFAQEKTDIGIFKSQGFTTGKLRLQFAIRFLIISVLGALLGTVLGSLFIDKLVSALLRGIGITNFRASFTFIGIVLPAAAICICFFIFAFLVSRKIKKVGIRQLISE